MANALVNFNSAAPSGLPYDMQMAQIQRQQKLAELLQQQAAQPIDVQTGGGQPAPIPWTAVLAKALQGVSASAKEGRAQQQMKGLSDADTQSAKDLMTALANAKTQTMGAPAVAGSTTNMPIPSLPGQPAPQGPGLTMQNPGIPAQAPTSAPDTDAQMAALLAAQGGPRTDAIRSAMLPQVMNRQNMAAENQMNRDNKLWENTLPMSTAAQQTMAAQGQQARQNAQYENQLPMTAAQRAANDVADRTLNETHSYHQEMTGAGLTEGGVQNPAVLSWRDAIKRGDANMANVPAPLKNAVAISLNNTDKTEYTPRAASLNTLAASRITAPYTNMAAYKLTADALPYLERIAAASKVPGSVSDQDLLDSLTKLNTGGNAVTEAQVSTITGGKSYADWAGTVANKFQNGGVLSDNQRQQIKEIAGNIYANYQKGFQPVYEQAAKQLTEAGIPKPFWTIPDLNNLNAKQGAAMGGVTTQQNIAPAGTKATGPSGKTLTSDGKGGWN